MDLPLFLWSVADLLRKQYKQQEYGKVILLFTLRCYMDGVLASTKAAVFVEPQGHGLHTLAEQL